MESCIIFCDGRLYYSPVFMLDTGKADEISETYSANREDTKIYVKIGFQGDNSMYEAQCRGPLADTCNHGNEPWRSHTGRIIS